MNKHKVKKIEMEIDPEIIKIARLLTKEMSKKIFLIEKNENASFYSQIYDCILVFSSMNMRALLSLAQESRDDIIDIDEFMNDFFNDFKNRFSGVGSPDVGSH